MSLEDNKRSAIASYELMFNEADAGDGGDRKRHVLVVSTVSGPGWRGGRGGAASAAIQRAVDCSVAGRVMALSAVWRNEAMSESVCLDGVKVELDVDRVEVDLKIPGLEPAMVAEDLWERCETGEAMEPVATYRDGTVIYFHCAPEGEPPSPSYRVESPRPHEWAIELGSEPEGQGRVRVARLHVRFL